MNLSNEQKLALAQHIAAEYSLWIKEELEYQVEDMKDSDALSWDYYTNIEDVDDITNLVTDLIAVPVQ